MNANEAFFDTNILLYLVSADTTKATRAEALLRVGGVVSVQVLTEFADVASRKYKNPWERVRAVLSAVTKVCRVESISIETHRQALDIAERYRFRIFDCMIIAAASIANCTVLYSEDLRDGQSIGAVTIRNPFVHEGK